MSTLQERWFGRTDLERMDHYTVGSFFAINAVAAFLALMLAPVSVSGVGVSQLRRTSAVVFVLAVVASSIVHAKLVREALDVYCGTGQLAKQRLLPGGALTLVALVAASFMQVGAEANTVSPWFAIIAVLPALTVWSVLLHSRNMLVALTAATALLPLAIHFQNFPSAGVALVFLWFTYVMVIGGIVLSVRLSAWILEVTRELDLSRQTAGRLAVAEERLRFSRDLHDVVGRSLSAISLTNELASALLERGRVDEARAQLEKSRELIASAQSDMRAVVADYRRADIVDEAASARGLATASGIVWNSNITAEVAAALTPESREALAWALREGTTNALRHAQPTRIDAVLERLGDGTRLTLTNDGANNPPLAVDDGGGHGLLGLQERLAPLGGTIKAERDGDRFVLSAQVPNERS